MANRQEIEAEFQRRMAADKASGGKNQARFMQAYQSFQNMPDDDLPGLFPDQQPAQTQPQAVSANMGQVQTLPAQTTQQSKIDELIEKALGRGLEQKQAPGWQQMLANALAGAAGRDFPFKAQQEDDFGKKIAETVITEQAKRKFRSPLEELIEQSKVAEAAKTMGNRRLYESVTGAGKTSPQIPEETINTQDQNFNERNQQPQTQSSEDFSFDVNNIKAPEIDPFTGKLTSAGERQKVLNERIANEMQEQGKNLSGEAAIRYSGALQAIKNIQEIINLLKINKSTQEQVTARPDIKKVILGQKAASFKEPEIPFTNIPITAGIVEGGVQAFAGEDARLLDLKLRTLSENVIRGRTGAAVTKQEDIDEKMRTFLRLLDNPKVMLERLLEDEFLMKNTVNSIRKGSSQGVNVPTGERTEFENQNDDPLGIL